jgi:tetratricopeptide (TPR) repeat protein
MRFAPLVALLLAAPLAAQTVAEHVAMGDSAEPFLHPDVALRHYREALALDSLDFAANWKAARALADVAKQLTGDDTKAQRDSLYSVGRVYAERALRIDSTRAEGHYVVALVLGRLSRTRGGRERVRFAQIIYDQATRTIQLDSTMDGAWHILGAWHAEVKRLSGFTRFFAKALFGAGFMDKANWADAQRNLERAVALRPEHVYHRLELAQVYVDVGKYTRAREQLTTIATLPISDVMDPSYQRDAAKLLADIRDKKDES